jgi:glycosyltransferase involved in cell wall biosynthesis
VTPGSRRPRRIGIVTTGLGIGGAEAMLFRVVTNLDRERFTLRIVSVMDDGDYGPLLREAGIPVESIGFTNRVPTPARAARLVRAIQSFRPDAVVGWMYHGNLAASFGRAWAAPDAGLAWNIRHSVYNLRYERFVTRNLIRLGARLSNRVDATIYVSEVSRTQHVGLGYDPASAVVIGNGMNPPTLPSEAEKARTRAELGIALTDVVVGHVARYHPMKDHATFLRAMIRAIRVDPRLKAVLVGRDVGSNPAIRSLLDDPVLSGRVIVLGERGDVARLLGAMDIFCQSSFSEGFPNAVLEAAMAGLPSVVTDVGASAEIAGSGATLVAPRDPQGMANAICDLAAMSPVQRTSRGLEARSHAIECCSLDAVVDSYSALFDAVSGPRSGRRRFTTRTD